MFGMVTALVVQEPGTAAAEGAIVTTARAAGSTAYTCRLGGLG
jgi:hypothetical protein